MCDICTIIGHIEVAWCISLFGVLKICWNSPEGFRMVFNMWKSTFRYDPIGERDCFKKWAHKMERSEHWNRTTWTAYFNCFASLSLYLYMGSSFNWYRVVHPSQKRRYVVAHNLPKENTIKVQPLTFSQFPSHGKLWVVVFFLRNCS